MLLTITSSTVAYQEALLVMSFWHDDVNLGWRLFLGDGEDACVTDVSELYTVCIAANK
jgi:hypothetical protein